MRKFIYNILLLILFTSFGKILNSQSVSVIIKRVSITNVRGHVLIEWYSVQNPNNYPFQISRTIDETSDITEAIDTVSALTTSYIDSSVNAGQKSYGYRIILMTPGEGRTGSAIHRTIHLSVAIDTCSEVLNFSWTHYDGWEKDNSSVDYYDIICWSAFDSKKTTGGTWCDTLTNYVETSISLEGKYYWIRAFNKDNNKVFSVSNVIFLNKPIPPYPKFINPDFCIIEDNSARIQFSIDTSAETTEYKIFRELNNKKEMVWEDSLFKGHILTFTDYTIDVSKSYKYFVSTYKCGIEKSDVITTYANTSYANNIILSSIINESVIELSWNTFDAWGKESLNYSVYRRIDENQFEKINTIQNLNFNEDAKAISRELNAGSTNNSDIIGIQDLCYYIESINSRNDTCKSNLICVVPDSPPNAPTAIVPSDPENNRFSANFLFLPKEFQLSIYNKGGSKVWETNDPKDYWTGRFFNTDQIVPDGIYFYIIKRTDSEGNKKEPSHGIVHVLSVNPN